MAPKRYCRRRDYTGVLPASLLALILSFVPLRTAFLCATLSTAWLAAFRELLATAAHLDFGSDFAHGLPPKRYRRVVEAALELCHPETLRSVKLFFEAGPKHDAWLDLILRKMKTLQDSASKGVTAVGLELQIGRLAKHRKTFQLKIAPRCWRLLTSLSASTYKSDSPDSTCRLCLPLKLPFLQSLSLRRVDIIALLDTLFDQCPLLSTLKLVECKLERVDISSQRLTSLTINACSTWNVHIRIAAPALKLFHFYGDISDLALQADGLEDVYLCNDGPDMEGAYYEGNYVTSLLQATTLTLSDCFFKDISYKAPPLIFSKLKSLQLLIRHYEYTANVREFLWACCFPVVETIAIEFRDMPDPYLEEEDDRYDLSIPALSLSELRAVSIRGTNMLEYQVKMMNLFLFSPLPLNNIVLSGKGSMTPMIVLRRANDGPVEVPPPPHEEFYNEVYDRLAERMNEL